MRDFLKYLLVNVPGWMLVSLLGWAAVRWWSLPAWLAILIVASWVGKDLLLFPSMRRYYQSEPAQQRMHGERGVALSSLDPEGLVRVHGEIWQARVDDAAPFLPQGALVRVRGVVGLLLRVDEDSERCPVPRQ